MKDKKWTKQMRSVHQRAAINGHAEFRQFIHFQVKPRCPLIRNSRGAREGTLPGKA
jgi:hypothetical protein